MSFLSYYYKYVLSDIRLKVKQLFYVLYLFLKRKGAHVKQDEDK